MDASALDSEKDESSPSLPSRRRTDAPDSVRVLRPRRAAPADAVRPTRWDLLGAALCLLGMAVIMFSPRPA